MAKIKTKDIFAKDMEELKNDLRSARQDLSNLLMDHSQFKLKNTRQIFNKRKEIAKILTVLRTKELTEVASK